MTSALAEIDASAREERWRVLVPVVVVSVVIGVLAARQFSGDDLDVYRGAGRALLDGINPYTHPLPGTTIAFSYTPFSSTVFVPVALLARPLAFFLLTLASLACLWYAVRRIVGATWDELAARDQLRLSGVVWGALLISEPVTQTLGLGQVNTILIAMVLADVLRTRESRWQGTWIGLATAFKLTPGIFVLYLLATRRYRAAATAVGTFALTVAVGFAAMPGPSVSYWIDGVGADPRHVGEVNFVANQSILGSLTRVVGYDAARPWWLVACVPVVLAGTWISVRARARWGEVAGLASMAFVACLVSPYSWSHHFIWFVVPALLLARAARRSGSGWLRLATVGWTVPFFVGPFWFVPREAWRLDHHPAGQALVGAWYALQLLVGFAVVAWLFARRPSPGEATDQAPDIDTSPMTRLAR